jgi:hypothetical protein
MQMIIIMNYLINEYLLEIMMNHLEKLIKNQDIQVILMEITLMEMMVMIIS